MQHNSALIRKQVRKATDSIYLYELDIIVEKHYASVNAYVQSIYLYARANDDKQIAELIVDWSANDSIEETMRLFYNEEAFNEELVQILIKAGFSEEAARDIRTSESGMQDKGHASYDAYKIGNEVRAAMQA